MPQEIGDVFLKMINKIWREGGIPESWSRGIICPIYKRREMLRITEE